MRKEPEMYPYNDPFNAANRREAMAARSTEQEPQAIAVAMPATRSQYTSLLSLAQNPIIFSIIIGLILVLALILLGL